jgi:hypothetical protein
MLFPRRLRCNTAKFESGDFRLAFSDAQRRQKRAQLIASAELRMAQDQ